VDIFPDEATRNPVSAGVIPVRVAVLNLDTDVIGRKQHTKSHGSLSSRYVANNLVSIHFSVGKPTYCLTTRQIEVIH
jgi:hypothetical protein